MIKRIASRSSSRHGLILLTNRSGDGSSDVRLTASVLSDAGAPRVIDPEARAYLDWMQLLGLPTLAEQGAEEARRLNRLRVPMLAGEPEPVARIEDVRVPGPGGSIA